MRMTRSERPGKVVVFVAASLSVLLGFVALAIDGGVMQDDHQRAQSAADAAALAAAEKLFQMWQTGFGADVGGQAAAAATTVAAQNGFPNPTVHIPPTSGLFVGQAGYAEVIVSYSQGRFFSKIWGTSKVSIGARAVASGRWYSPKDGILVLDPTGDGSLTLNGGATVSVTGAPTVVDSNAWDAATTTGGGTITSTELDVTGVPGTQGSGFLGPVYDNQTPIPDPLAYLPEPDPTTMTVQSKKNVHASGGTLSILPGVYTGGITISGQATLVMAPGIYYMNGGGFSFTGQGNLTAPGVMIVNAPYSNSDNVNINGTGVINLSPMTTGIYAGISLWQVRNLPYSSTAMNISGNGGSTMTGTFYDAKGTLNVTGNGTNNVIGSQYISYDLKVSGNGAFSVNWNANLVGRTRLIGLVE